MRVGIHAVGLNPDETGGVGVYLRNLIRNLSGDDSSTEYMLFVAEHGASAFTSDLPRHIHPIVIPPPLPVSPLIRCLRYWGWLPSSLAAQLEESGVDVIHYPDSTINPPSVKLPCVLTVHDIQHEYFPRHFSLKTRLLRKLTYGPSMRKARRIIANSQFTKKTLVEKLRLPADRITPIYWGVDAAFSPDIESGEVERVRHKYHLPPTFAFYPANTWPHKNHPRLVQALSHLQQKYRSDCKLVLCGQPQWGHNALLAALETHHLQQDVLLLGYVPTADLPALYHAASLLVYPSLFEGFGIPLVEAMSCACPIVCSNVTSLPEVAGDAALLVNPYDAEELADAIQHMLRDRDLRSDLVAKGLVRAGHFSWERAACQTAQVYRQACRG
jgi:glycosyltransferase involved in cell wall biosynthesis